MPDTDFEYARAIGEKLRAIRQRQKISLRELAKRASISASMLSQIETGKAYPSVRSIYSIAAALDLPVDYFFPEQDGSPAQADEEPIVADEMTASDMREATINKAFDEASAEAALSEGVISHALHANERPSIVLKGGVTWSRLTAGSEPNIEFLEIVYACGAASGETMSHHTGREFGLILEGELVVQLGFKQMTLQAGDSIVFESMTPHRLMNKSSQPMRALWVIWNC